jgi:hypothetical protein
MTREERLTLRAILGDFKKGLVELDYVEAHIDCLIAGETDESAEVAGATPLNCDE